MHKMVDLGRKQEDYPSTKCCDPAPKGKMVYPTLYLSDIQGLDLSTGEISGTFKGKVVSVSDRDKYSCEIEVHAISVSGSKGGLEESLDNILKKKEESDDDE